MSSFNFVIFLDAISAPLAVVFDVDSNAFPRPPAFAVIASNSFPRPFLENACKLEALNFTFTSVLFNWLTRFCIFNSSSTTVWPPVAFTLMVTPSAMFPLHPFLV